MPPARASVTDLVDEWLSYPSAIGDLKREPDRRPILITSATRSGSTWTGHMLHSKGVRHYNQPFTACSVMFSDEVASLGKRLDVKMAAEIMAAITAGRDLKFLIPYVNGQRERRLHRFGPWRNLKNPFGRILLRDPTAALLSEWLDQTYALEVLVTFRHPCGVISSWIKHQYSPVEKLDRISKCQELMDGDIADYAHLITGVRKVSPIAALSLRYCVVNQVLWNSVARNPSWHTCRFEDLCSDPMREFRKLFERLGLNYNEDVRRKHQTLTTGQVTETGHRHQVKKNTHEIARIWRQRLDTNQIREIRRIYDQFDLPVHRDPVNW